MGGGGDQPEGGSGGTYELEEGVGVVGEGFVLVSWVGQFLDSC